MRPIPKRFRSPALHPAAPFRRYDDGRETCYANPLGRDLYQQRKVTLFERQSYLCLLESCGKKLSLADSRMINGSWEPSGQLRDDRIVGPTGQPMNGLVHKGCLHGWHAQHNLEPQSQEPAAGPGGFDWSHL